MQKLNPEIKVLLNVMPKEKWQEAILEKLNFHPLTFGDLSQKFGFEKDTVEYLDFMILVSSLQQRNWGGKSKVKSAYVEEKRIYPLYRVDQEDELERKGVLSEDIHIRPLVIAREFGIEASSFLPSKER